MTDAAINKDPEILGGTPVFSGTRVPVRILMGTWKRLDEFLTPRISGTSRGSPSTRQVGPGSGLLVHT